MKNIVILTLTVFALLITGAHQSSSAAIEALKPEQTETTKSETPVWTVEISPAPGLDSYATREIRFPETDNQEASSVNSADTIVIQPRAIPDVPADPECNNCQHQTHRSRCRSAYCQSRPWSRSAWYPSLQSYPGLDLYSDLIRSNWYGSPYPGHIFYYNGYRPSFRFGSLQFRGFGDYDRMYNPRIIPFGYQYTGLRGYYTALALTEQFGF